MTTDEDGNIDVLVHQSSLWQTGVPSLKKLQASALPPWLQFLAPYANVSMLKKKKKKKNKASMMTFANMFSVYLTF